MRACATNLWCSDWWCTLWDRECSLLSEANMECLLMWCSWMATGKRGDRECSLEQALKRGGMVYSWHFTQHLGLFFLLSACARKAFLLRETELARSVVYCSFAGSTASRCRWPHCSHRALLLPSSCGTLSRLIIHEASTQTECILTCPNFFKMHLLRAVEQSWGEPLSCLVGSLSWNS